MCVPFIAIARNLFRKVLREVDLPSWKSPIPECYGLVADLAKDLLTVVKKLKVPRRALIPNPIKKETHLYIVSFLTLLVLTEGSTETWCPAAYAHHQFPNESETWGPEADFSQVTVSCNLMAADVKLTDNQGNNSQVDGELLGKMRGVELLKFIKENSLVKFHAFCLCSASMTIEKCLRNWFHGAGVLDKPMQQLTWTSQADYAVPRIEDLPAQWLSSTARTMLGLKIPTIVFMVAAEVITEVEKDVLDAIADKHHTINKALTIVQFMLKFKTQFKNLQVAEQRMIALKKFIRKHYKKVVMKLAVKSTKISQGLKIEHGISKVKVFVQRRYDYRAILIAKPASISFSRLVLRIAHGGNHLASSNKILVKIRTAYLFTGGALTYLDKLRKSYTLCRRLQPRPIQQEMGEVSRRLKGKEAHATTIWRYQTCDLFGPFECKAWPGHVKGRDIKYLSRLGSYFSVITAPEWLEEPTVRITALTPCFKL